MEPMKPMTPMEPLPSGDVWWPDDLGEPSSSGVQNEVRYAFFPSKRCLLVKRDGTIARYYSGDHDIGGMEQRDGEDPTFTTRTGTVRLSELRRA